MVGTKPAASVFIVRDFRGQRLALTDYRGNGYRWISDVSKAQAFTMDEAMPIVERASRDWGTACAVVDKLTGTLAQPKAAQALNQAETSVRERMIREAATNGRQRLLRQAAARTADVSEHHKRECGCDNCEGLRGGTAS